MIWNENKECMSREDMRALQGKRLHKIVTYVYHNVPFYRKNCRTGHPADDIQSIDDIVRLPFTTKQDLRDNYPFGLQAAPQSEIVRIHASSGTTGNPTIVGYTRKDIGVWSECMSRCLTAYGVSRNDTFSVAYGYGLFLGARCPLRGRKHRCRRLARLDRQHGKTPAPDPGPGCLGIACTPSYALYLAETMKRMGITKEQIRLRVSAFGAEPWTEEMRREIEDKLGLKAYNLYGLSESWDPASVTNVPVSRVPTSTRIISFRNRGPGNLGTG